MKTRPAAKRSPAVLATEGGATHFSPDRAIEAPVNLGKNSVRLVYASRGRASASDEGRAADVQSILNQAREHNSGLGITGLLLAANGHYLQVLEGPRAAVESLFERIQNDTRHDNVSVLLSANIEAAIFPAWSMWLVERSEPENVTADRVRALRLRLSEDAAVSPADFFRLMLAPSNGPLVPRLRCSKAHPPDAPCKSISSVAFASRTGMWSAAVLQHVAAKSMLRLGRTSVTNPADPTRRTLIEYLDTELPERGPLRALSLHGEVSDCAPLALLVERLSLLVFMLTPSDLEQFVPYARAWLALPQVLASRPKVLILAGLPAERMQPVADELGAHLELEIISANVKLSDAAAVWRTVQSALPNRVAAQGLSAAPVSTGALDERPAAETALVSAAQGGAAPHENALEHMLADSACLQELLGLEGALYAAVLDTEEARLVLCAPHSEAAEQAAFDDAAFLRAKRRLVRSLDADEFVEDIVLTTALFLKVFRPLRKRPTLFLAVTLASGGVGLAAVRIKLQDVESALDLLPL